MEQPIHARMVGALPVPNVQDLAAKVKSTDEVPERYIRPEIEAVEAAGVELPVIDLGRLLDRQFFPDESAKLAAACEELGFFQLINHGVSKDVIEKMKADTMEYFQLSLEEKQKSAPLPNTLEGYSQGLVVSEEQKLNWADVLYLITRPLHYRAVEIWPAQPSSFRDTISNYSLELKKVAMSLIEVMAKSLELTPQVLLDKFKDEPQGLVIHYYPPCPKADKVYGAQPHSDANVLALLIEANGVQGLQIKKNGKWLPVQPLSEAFIVNIGDILEMLTNGKYKSVQHRVMVNTEKVRISISVHQGARQDAMIGPLPELIKDGKKNYKSVTYRDFMTGYFTARHERRRYLENMKS